MTEVKKQRNLYSDDVDWVSPYGKCMHGREYFCKPCIEEKIAENNKPMLTRGVTV